MKTTTEIPRSVALVGRPNVGKSRLFNRLVGRRISIVHDQPGVTRDLLTAEVDDGRFLLMDTGGIGLFEARLTPKVIADAVEEQVDFAINAASLVLLIADASEGCVPLDLEVAARLRAAGKRVLVVANKADTEERDAARDEFYAVGFGDPILISAEHGRGCDFLMRRIAEIIGPPDTTPKDTFRPIRLALAGRPNVGKSSLGNRLIGRSKLIVTDIAGTTRDPVRAPLEWTDPQGVLHRFDLVDTAGRRAANKRDTLDFFSHVRAGEILAQTDVVFLVIDASEGVTRIDLQLGGELVKSGAGIVVVVNKWDLAIKAFQDGGLQKFKDESLFRKKFTASLRKALFFLPEPPLLFVSALTGLRTDDMLAAAAGVYMRAGTEIPTGKINRAIQELMVKRAPRPVSGKRFKCYYVTQVSHRPIRFRLFCNSDERLEAGYERFLAKGVHEKFDLAGVPVFLDLVGKPKQEKRGFFVPQGTLPSELAENTAAKNARNKGGKFKAPKSTGGRGKGKNRGGKAAYRGPRAGVGGPTRLRSRKSRR